MYIRAHSFVVFVFDVYLRATSRQHRQNMSAFCVNSAMVICAARARWIFLEVAEITRMARGCTKKNPARGKGKLRFSR